jgi:protease II
MRADAANRTARRTSRGAAWKHRDRRLFLAARKVQPGKVTQYLEAENAYTAAMTKGLEPFSDALYKEMLGRIKQTDLSVPTPRHGYLYYSRTEEGKQYPIQCRRKGTMEAPEEVLLDLNELGKDKKFVGLGGFRGERRPEPGGLHHRLHRLPPVRSAGEGSAHGTDAARHHRARHFAGLGCGQ